MEYQVNSDHCTAGGLAAALLLLGGLMLLGAMLLSTWARLLALLPHAVLFEQTLEICINRRSYLFAQYP